MMFFGTMNSLPMELIVTEISYWLVPIDKQLLRKINTIFRDIFPYEKIELGEINFI